MAAAPMHGSGVGAPPAAAQGGAGSPAMPASTNAGTTAGSVSAGSSGASVSRAQAGVTGGVRASAGAGTGGRGTNAGMGPISGAAAGGGTPSAGTGGAPAASKHTPVPSAGCGKSGRPSAGVVTVAGSHIYSFPASYDGKTPMPLIVAFHAAGNSNDQLRNITKGSALETHFVMAFPKSQGNGWVLSTDSSRIDMRYEELRQNYCIDESRVFATGHSSGAQLIVQLMCRNDPRFFAIAPVASSAYCQKWNKPIPALIIHGADDRERANTNQDADGTKDLAPYLASNMCSMNTAPHAQAHCSSGSTQVDPGCVDYQACAQPTTWCHHNDPQYSNTNHGWPCFANLAIDAFFTSFL